MTVTEAIKRLTDVLANAGDLDMVDLVVVNEGWAIDRKRQFDVLAVTDPDGSGEVLVCAFMGTEMFCECEEDEKRPRLALVKTETVHVED